MFKILILLPVQPKRRGDRAVPVERPPRASFRRPLRGRVSSLYNQNDEETERFLSRDLLARRFVGLSGGEFGPDFTTIWRFKEALTEAGTLEALREAFSNQLDELGFQASKGRIVDASIVPAPRQRNSREENEAIREGNPPLDWSEAKRRQKDVDARWTKKREQDHFGYKNHIAFDVKHKFIHAWQVSAAHVHDSQVFEEILARTTSRDVYADSAYLSEASRERFPQSILGRMAL